MINACRSLRPPVTMSRTTARRAGALTTFFAAPHGSPRSPAGHPPAIS
jgi:hypothetical protein